MKFKSDIEVQAGLKDSSGSIGASGQILSSTNGNVSWVTPTVNTIARDVQNEVKAGVAINKGQAVYVTGADGTNIIVGLASNTSEATSSKTLGLLNATVAVNGFADVVQIGRLSGLNTIGAVVGDPVWLGTNGNLIYGLTNKPYAPAHLVFIGVVTIVNANNGEIFITVQNGFELNEIHDVDLKTNVPVNGDILGYNGTLWVNKTIAGWLGYTPQNAATAITTSNIGSQSVNYANTAGSAGSVDFNNLTNKTGGTGTYQTSGDFRAPIFYDSNDTTYYADLASTSQTAVRQRGGTLHGPNPTWGAYLLVGGDGRQGYIDSTTTASVSTTNGNLHLDAASGSGTYINFYDGSVVNFGDGANNTVSTINNDGSHRPQILYDYNNTGYYADLASTGTSVNIAGSLNAATYNKPAILVNSSGTGSTGSAIGMQQVTTEGWTGIFVDFEPNTGWGFYHDNPSNNFLITAETTTGSIGSNVVPSRSSGNRTAYTKFQFQQGDGIGIAGGSWRAPIFYDSNNTGYYIDPSSTSYISSLTVDNTITGNISGTAGSLLSYQSNWASTPAKDNVVGLLGWKNYGNSHVIFDASASTTPSGTACNNTNPQNNWSATYPTLMGWNGANTYGVRVDSARIADSAGSAGSVDFNNLTAKLGGTGTYQTSGDFRAPIFYDSDNTSFYLNPTGVSNLNSVDFYSLYSNRNNSAGAAFNLDNVGSSTWPVLFKTYAVGNDNESGFWVSSNGYPDMRLRREDGTVRALISSWERSFTTFGITDSTDMRAPIFYTSGNTGFYLNPAGTSFLNTLVVDSIIGGNINGNANSANQARRIANPDRTNFTVGGNANTFYPVAMIVGAGSTQAQYAEFMIERGGYDDPGYTGIGFSTFNARFTYKPTGWGFGASYFNLEQLTQTTPCLGDYLDQYQSGISIVWLRGATTYWVYSIVGNITMIYDNAAGGNYVMPYGTYTPITSPVAKAQYAKYQDSTMLVQGSLLSGTDMKAPVFYDSNNTGYYLDPASTSVLSAIDTGTTGAYNRFRTWTELTGSHGFYSSVNGAHIYPNNSSYGSWKIEGSRNGWAGIEMQYGSNGNISFMTNSTSGESGMHNNSYGWQMRWTSGGLFSGTGAYGGGEQRVLNENQWINSKYFDSGGRIYGTVFMDANDSSFYFDGSDTGDSIRVAGDIVAYYSDERLKDKKGNIENALEKVLSLNGFYYEPNEKAQAFGYKKKLEVGLSAQEVEAVLPEIIKDAPIGRGYKTLDYGKLTPLLIEAIKEQQQQIDDLKELVNKLINK